MKRGKPPAFVRSALLQLVLTVTAACVAAATVNAGYRLACTALVEFGILSAIVAMSAGLLCVQYGIRMCGLLTDHRRIESLDARLGTLCYVGLAAYALWNGMLDFAIPRRDSDPASYPGLLCALIAVMVVALILETKYRLLQTTPSRSLLESLSDDTFYLMVGVVTLLALVAHVFAPNWWLDTVIDAVVTLFAILRVRALRTPTFAVV